MVPTQNPLPEAVRSQITSRLQVVLSALLNAAVQVWTAHWNVRGVDYEGLHKRFGKILADTHAAADRVAEMSRQLGGEPIATVTAQPGVIQPTGGSAAAGNAQAYVAQVAGILSRRCRRICGPSSRRGRRSTVPPHTTSRCGCCSRGSPRRCGHPSTRPTSRPSQSRYSTRRRSCCHDCVTS